MRRDVVPRESAAFEAWAVRFVEGLAIHGPALGITPPAAGEVEALQAASRAASAARTAMRAATAHQRTKRKAIEKQLRQLARQVQAHPATTDVIRQALGLRVPDTTRTVRRTPIQTRPVAEIDTSQSLRHIIHFRDQGSQKRARPEGVHACEIRRSVGVPPEGMRDRGDAGNMEFVALDTATPHLASYAQADAGKRVYYRLRWVGSRGELGPWSEVVEAVIG